MSTSGQAVILLRAGGVDINRLMTLLQPSQQRMPNNEESYQQLLTQLRRIGHIAEWSPRNICNGLRANQNQSPACLAGVQQQQPNQDPWHLPTGQGPWQSTDNSNNQSWSSGHQWQPQTGATPQPSNPWSTCMAATADESDNGTDTDNIKTETDTGQRQR